MAALTSYLLASVLTPEIDTGLFAITRKLAIDNSAANGSAYPQNADNIQVVTINRNARLLSSHLNAKATLGASATLKLQLNRAGTRTDLTTATTAGAASLVTSATIGPVDLQAGDVIEALVGGANVSAAASVEIDLTLQH